ncbi:MAG: tRNA preQ1(34) S-adenosylmethionine ribosyltransferase-isomerase QueA [Verrucomicrobiae bacterium]|nr:tRNA preQ1(34) S-adenosylmethionine ribosyltransferase-isomerase QueA [Verrucomicrobiae bacterium]
MDVWQFNYDLPKELIAQSPLPHRDESRLMVVHRSTKEFEHRRFSDLPSYLRAGDVLVLNDSKVIQARLWAIKPKTGGVAEILLLENIGKGRWRALVRPAKRVRAGTKLVLVSRHTAAALDTAISKHSIPYKAQPGDLQENPTVTVLAREEAGRYLVDFGETCDPEIVLSNYGEVPLPPYIERKGPPSPEDQERYQTVYARKPGSVAAPTAGLHFTESLLERLKHAGVEIHFVTLHIGLGTFAPVTTSKVENHVLHEEFFELPQTTADAVNSAKREGRRIVSVGTTVTRVLESVAAHTYQKVESHDAIPPGAPSLQAGEKGFVHGCRGRTRLFIYPPYTFRVVDVLLTNFHLPKSTLLMLVCAFADPGGLTGRDLILKCYSEAVSKSYRFYSYGDAMLLL